MIIYMPNNRAINFTKDKNFKKCRESQKHTNDNNRL